MLSKTHTNCRAYEWLKSNVEKDEIRLLKRALRELYSEFKIRRKIEKKTEIYCLPKYNVKSAKAGCSIFGYISKAKKPLTVNDLARKLHLKSRYVSKVCKRFGDKGYITKGEPKPIKKTCFFTPITGEVVHSGNYERVQILSQELSGIVSRHKLEDPRMKQNLRNSLESMQGREDLIKFNSLIEEFKGELLTKVDAAETKSEIRQHLTVKPFHPKVPTWKARK